MKVITFQSKEALKYLEKNGYLRCEDKYIDKDKMSQTYNWAIQNMNERVKIKAMQLIQYGVGLNAIDQFAHQSIKENQ